MSGVFSPVELTEGVSGLIRESKHYGQVRVIILDEEALPRFSCLAVQLIHEKLELPVIYLRCGDDFDPRFMMMWRNRVVEPYGLTEGTVERLLDLVLANGVNMLQVAHMIARNLDLVHNV
ncbi:hypothetical protein H8D76_01150 [Candidatus Bathyarchaeota archaeon]|nr:hypothetical protein [Candidatus Bathyarchaeota archaeon]